MEAESELNHSAQVESEWDSKKDPNLLESWNLGNDDKGNNELEIFSKRRLQRQFSWMILSPVLTFWYDFFKANRHFLEKWNKSIFNIFEKFHNSEIFTIFEFNVFISPFTNSLDTE